MFDNLRDSSFYEEEEQNNELYTESAPQPAVVRRRRKSGRFLGMTAQQRFLLSTMFLFTVCVMGVLAMMVLGRMSLF
jgi:hypothetical protein